MRSPTTDQAHSSILSHSHNPRLALFPTNSNGLAMVTTLPPTYRAYVYENFGDALQEIKLRSGLVHAQLQPTQIRIKVHSAAVNPADYKFVEIGEAIFPARPTPEAPFRLGFDVAGTVVEVGPSAQDVNVGGYVYGMAYFGTFTTFAEYVVMEADHVAPIPKNMAFNQAAGVPAAALTSYQALVTHGNLRGSLRVLVLGGSSATGIFGIQIAKALGASFIAATTNTRNIALVRALGVDQVIDYTSEKWSESFETHFIDLIYDCGVEPRAWQDGAQRVLKQTTGVFVTIGVGTTPTPSTIGASFMPVQLVPSRSDLITLTKLIEADQLATPIDSVFAFENLLDEIKKQKSNRARGKIIIEVS